MSLADEESISSFWEKYHIFEKSMKMNRGKEYTFLDGPPFATGLPHYGHLLASIVKDSVPRYKTQRGFTVQRKWGWDTHGLPVEFEIEKAYGLKTRQDVLEYGLANYNDRCKEIVLKYREEWKYTISKLGRWVDMENDYKTMDIKYMESVWWVFAELYRKKLVYVGYKVMPYSLGCNTPLSNFEATSTYKDVSDPSLILSFVGDDNLKFLVWTTTPWTLPTNLALAVNSSEKYSTVRLLNSKDKSTYIVAEKCIGNHFKKDTYKVVETRDGSYYVGYKYTSLYPDKHGQYIVKNIISANYVETKPEGSCTGIAHLSPAYGKEDFQACIDNGLLKKDELPYDPLDSNGYFPIDFHVEIVKGKYIKEADIDIVKDIKGRGLCFKYSKEKHSYPFCWRSDTPLIYRAVKSTFVNMETITPKLVANNKLVNWKPSHIGENRFGNWIETSHDWCVSRNRYWGTVIPMWKSEDGQEIIVVESINELEKLAGLENGSITNLHKQYIEKIKIPSKQGNGYLTLSGEVFDCWFESGSMPYASKHYPFENSHLSPQDLVGDFIAEGLDQTRGWFYTLMVLSTALFDQPAFKNVVVNGLILAEDGQKMSKSKKNYPDPMVILNKFGSDVLRLYMLDSNVTQANNLKFKEEDLATHAKYIIMLKNSFKYYQENVDVYNAQRGNFTPSNLKEIANSPNLMDKWIMQSLRDISDKFLINFDNYNISKLVSLIESFIGNLSKWYIKLNRNRCKSNDVGEFHMVLSVLYNCLKKFSILSASIIPFISESIYQKLKLTNDPESVHLCLIEEIDIDFGCNLLEPMNYFMRIFDLVRSMRPGEVKIPIQTMYIIHNNLAMIRSLKTLETYFLEELNVLNVEYEPRESKYLNYELSLNKKLCGRRFGKLVRTKEQEIKNITQDQILDVVENTDVTICDTVYSYEEFDIKRTLKNIYKHCTYGMDKDLLLILDTQMTEHGYNIYYSKLLNRCVQDSRKGMGVKRSDDMRIYITLSNEECNFNKCIREMIDSDKYQSLYIKPQLGTTIHNYEGQSVDWKKTFKILNTNLVIYLYKTE